MSPRRSSLRARWSAFYGAFLSDLRDNLAVALPLIAAFIVLVLPGSAVLLCLAECGGSVRNFWEALFVTWQAMTTSGVSGELMPTSVVGRIIVSLDALVGYSMLGIIVFVIARAAEKHGRIADR